MNQINNIGTTQKVLDRNFLSSTFVNPIEDGNSINEGIVLTSELSSVDYDIYAYRSYVATYEIVSNINNVTTVKFTIEWIYNDSFGGSNPNGPYGYNNHNQGDAFILSSGSSGDFIYVKGYVSAPAENLSILSQSGSFYIYSVDLICVITEGSMEGIPQTGGQYFNTNRRIYDDEYSLTNDYPINLNFSKDVITSNIYFNWEDPTKKAVGYLIKIRPEIPISEGNPQNTIYQAFGSSLEFNGEIETLMYLHKSSGNSSYWYYTIFANKIKNRGTNYSLPQVLPNFNASYRDTNQLDYLAIYNQLDGGVEITNWKIFNATLNNIPGTYSEGTTLWKNINGEWQSDPITYYNDTLSTLTLLIHLEPNKFRNLWGEPFANCYVDLGIPGVDAAVLSLISGNDGNDFYEIEVFFLNGNPYDSQSEVDNIVGSTIQIHTGININAANSAYQSVPKIAYKNYPRKSNYVIANDFNVGKYYWSVCSIFDYEQKNYTTWSKEQLLVIN